MNAPTMENQPPRVRGPVRRVRLAYLVTHPIQYQVPLLKQIAKINNIDLHVFFQSDLSTREYADPGFGRKIQWDVPLLDGYSFEFLPSLGKADRIDKWRPFSRGLGRRVTGKFDVCWAHGVGRPYNLVAITTALALGIKVLIRDEVNEQSGPRTVALEKFKGVVFRFLYRAGTQFLAIGSRNRDYYMQHGVPPTHIHDVPYCVDNEYFQERVATASLEREAFRQSLGLDADRRIILFASKFTSRKRPGLLIDAFERIASRLKAASLPYLLMVGDGQLRTQLEQRVTSAGLHQIRFLGFKNQSELPAFFDLCDVFVLPSVNEPWGLIVNEAMNAGRAIIVSDKVGCASDLVKNGQNGYVVPADDSEALAGTLAQAICDPARLKAMGERSKQTIDRWSFDRDKDGLVLAIDAAMSL
jgi:glycosyltransferase involved in cell wall biosynthesis